MSKPARPATPRQGLDRIRIAHWRVARLANSRPEFVGVWVFKALYVKRLGLEPCERGASRQGRASSGFQALAVADQTA